MDWQAEMSMTQCVSHLCCNETMADVSFKFSTSSKESKWSSIPAHKFLLALRSSVFQAMFYGDLAEGRGDTSTTIEITDITPEIFNCFLRFLYTDKTTIDGDTVIPLLYASDKYNVNTLKQICQQFLGNNLNIHNVSTILNNADMFNMTELSMKALKYFLNNASNIFKTEEFMLLSLKNLGIIVSKDEINATEIEIFQAAMKWAEKSCENNVEEVNPTNKRAVLGEVFCQIRIPTMSLDDFSKVVAMSGTLSDKEQLQFFKYLTVQEKGSEIQKYPLTGRKKTKHELVLETGHCIKTKECGKKRHKRKGNITETITLSIYKSIIQLEEIEVLGTQGTTCKRCKSTPRFIVSIDELGQKCYSSNVYNKMTKPEPIVEMAIREPMAEPVSVPRQRRNDMCEGMVIREPRVAMAIWEPIAEPVSVQRRRRNDMVEEMAIREPIVEPVSVPRQRRNDMFEGMVIREPIVEMAIREPIAEPVSVPRRRRNDMFEEMAIREQIIEPVVESFKDEDESGMFEEKAIRKQVNHNRFSTTAIGVEIEAGNSMTFKYLLVPSQTYSLNVSMVLHCNCGLSRDLNVLEKVSFKRIQKNIGECVCVAECSGICLVKCLRFVEKDYI